MKRWVLILGMILMGWCLAKAAEQQPKNIYIRFKPISTGGVYATVSTVIHHDPWWVGYQTMPRSGETYARLRIQKDTYSGWEKIAPDWGTIVLRIFNPQPVKQITLQLQLANHPNASAVFKTMRTTQTGNIVGIVLPADYRENPSHIMTIKQNSEQHLKMAESLHLSQKNLPQKFSFYTSAAGGFNSLYTDPQILKNELMTIKLLGINGVPYPGDEQILKIDQELGFSRYDDNNWMADPSTIKRDKRISKGFPSAFKKIQMVCLMDEPGHAGVSSIKPGEFHKYLQSQGLTPADFNTDNWNSVKPVTDRQKIKDIAYNWGKKYGDAAKKEYYWTARYLEYITAMGFKNATGRVKKYYPPGTLTFTNFTDHPLILGGNMMNSIDWFNLGLTDATTLMWSEDWLYETITSWGNGLFQRLGFICDTLRSAASIYHQPLGYYNTMDANKNLLMKGLIVIGHGVKTIYYFDYGPTYAATENYWSDSLGEYKGVAKLIRDVGKAESLLYPGQPVPAKVAILYSTTNEIWDTGGFNGQEKQFLYIALAQEQYPADILSDDELLMEKDKMSSILSQYKVIYLVDERLPESIYPELKQYVKNGGILIMDPMAGTKDEYNNPSRILPRLIGAKETLIQTGDEKKGTDTLTLTSETGISKEVPISLYRKCSFSDVKGDVLGKFSDGSPAILSNKVGKGMVITYGFMPGWSFFDRTAQANPVPHYVTDFPVGGRNLIDFPCKIAKVKRDVLLDTEKAFEADLLVSKKGAALVLINLSRKPVSHLTVSVAENGIKSVSSIKQGAISFKKDNGRIVFTIPINLTDIILLKK
ncbi:MAG: beta-galactosidase trimerization domain-containing protein [Candidatus Omnitrophica bacterium]|nr:beta-galactosidase trimerization domain-containing protein [Candidatus Omnitrophota bacterium]